jgi:hypothetical protein
MFAQVQPQSVHVESVSGTRSTKNGHFLFTTTAPAVGCEAGFWLPTADANFNQYLARVNAALASKLSIKVSGDSQQMGPSAGDRYCRLTQVQ